ncbi:Hypothetical predicted protein [Podarcis lilfordi]|uniref:Uncharacterized protein n=1 Tax=Podarcis lilfordi TaxID=74358 RepID=A0AA35KUY4_9SAUR|nr:Hypothetical predicted protein [Podarcis lilfordi]
MSRCRSSSSSCKETQRRVPPSRRNKRCRVVYDAPLKKKKGYVRVCATYYYWKGGKK